MRYSGAPWQPLRSSTHVAVRAALGCFFAAFRGKLVTPRPLSQGSTAGGHRGQSPLPANTNVTIAARLKTRAATGISPCTYHSPQHQALGWVFQAVSEWQGTAPSLPTRADRNKDRLYPTACLVLMHCNSLRTDFWGHTYPLPRSALLLHRALPAQRGLGHTHSCPQLHQSLVKIPWAAPVDHSIGHVPGGNGSERHRGL